MATKPRDLVVRFLSDVQGFLRGTDQMAEAFDATARAQDELAREGDQAARKLALAYERAGDKMQRDTRGTRENLKGDFKETGREVGEEFASNLGESLASGDTSRIVQDSVGGLISSLAFAGPVGAAIAAGGTIALSIWNGFEEKTKARKDAVLEAAGEIYSGLLDQGSDFIKEYTDTVVRNFFDPSSQDQLAVKAREGAKVLSINLGAALSGGADSIAATADDARERLEKLTDAAQKNPLTSGLASDKERQALRDIVDYLDSITEGTKAARDAAEGYANALRLGAQYAKEGSSYAANGSTTRQQLGAAAPYVTGRRKGT